MHDKKTIETNISAEIAAIVDVDKKSVNPETPLESLGIDSMRLIEIMIFIEKEYGLSLMSSGLGSDSLRDVSSLAACVADALETDKS